MAASIKMNDFWDIAPWSLVEVYQHFRGAYCLYHLGNDTLKISQKTAIIIFIPFWFRT
jgi:hypothetical protein